MIFYHGTSEENWNRIQQEGILFGNRGTPSRCTYLATDKEEAMKYGPIVLQVQYDPAIHPRDNNYIEGCWQVRVYEPIPLTDVEKIN